MRKTLDLIDLFAAHPHRECTLKLASAIWWPGHTCYIAPGDISPHRHRHMEGVKEHSIKWYTIASYVFVEMIMCDDSSMYIADTVECGRCSESFSM